ncbi:uncharacterized protein UHOD_11661 [Ustilago sp. UG-2017b]|nr:uncharacterized protein UHOD_11661 [Ustilago sp. UG-2017b]
MASLPACLIALLTRPHPLGRLELDDVEAEKRTGVRASRQQRNDVYSADNHLSADSDTLSGDKGASHNEQSKAIRQSLPRLASHHHLKTRTPDDRRECRRQSQK